MGQIWAVEMATSGSGATTVLDSKPHKTLIKCLCAISHPPEEPGKGFLQGPGPTEGICVPPTCKALTRRLACSPRTLPARSCNPVTRKTPTHQLSLAPVNTALLETDATSQTACNQRLPTWGVGRIELQRVPIVHVRLRVGFYLFASI